MQIRATSEESGQALVELSFAFVLLCVFAFGIVDFSRAVYDAQVMANLAGEGSAMASRGTDPGVAAQAVVNYAGSDVSMGTKGCVIITVVTNQSGTLAITGQATQCAAGVTASSHVGCYTGHGCGSATLPAAARTALLAETSGSYLAVTEVFYNFNTISPITGLLHGSLLPSQLYRVAYY